MPIGVIIALLVIVAIIAVLAVAVPRMGGRTRPGRRTPTRREYPPDSDYRHDEPGRPREERALIREGEAIREHVESRLQRERRVRPVPIAPTPPVVADPAVHPTHDPAAYGTADPAAYGAPAPTAYGAADPAVHPGQAPAGIRPRRGRRLTARDELALQIEQDRRSGYHDPSLPGGPPAVDPELLPQTSSSDALELQLQDIAAASRTRPPAIVPPGVSRRRRRLGFARPYTAYEDPEVDRRDP